VTSLDDLAAQKQLLIAQANLDRLTLALAADDVRQVVWPRVDPARRGVVNSRAALAIGFALPLLGRSRLARVVRALSIGLMLYRSLRGFAAASKQKPTRD
jgi:hypothetical protein